MVINSQSVRQVRSGASGNGALCKVVMAARAKILRLTTTWFCAATVSFAPLYAQQDAASELDALIAPTLDVGSGIALARGQIAESDLIAAVATLERALIAHPDANEARLLYASLLCRLDDPAGARVEIDYLQGQSIPDSAWTEVTSACGPVAPAAGQ